MAIGYKIMDLGSFARAVKDNLDVDHVLMLGAGASASSGVKTAKECIWEWKYEIYLSNNPDAAEELDCTTETGQQRIQEWLDGNGGYPPPNDPGEYSFYAKDRFVDSEACRHYFEGIVAEANPGIGYKILALFVEYGAIKIVLTTNFDGLAEKALSQIGLNPQRIAIENSPRIHLPMPRNERFHIALHGDFKFGIIKNTSEELDTQEEDFIDALRIHLYNKHLIVMGYSGRDGSLMSMLEKAYTSEKKGGGKLFWCNRSDKPSKEVEQLLSNVSAKGRDARLVVAGDFDESLEILAKHCFRGISDVTSKLRQIVSLVEGEAGDVVVKGVEVERQSFINQTTAVDADIARLGGAALDAAAQAALIGAWTEDDVEQIGSNEARDDS